MIEREMLIPEARDFALKAHDGLATRRLSGFTTPAIMHIQQVADLVWVSGGTVEEVAAAWLHDVIEDTPATLADIHGKFGEKVAALVEGLTDHDEITGLPVKQRKQKQADRIKAESKSVQRIKIADQTSNICSLATDPTTTMTHDELKDYLEGAKLIAEACGGVSPLLDQLFKETYLRAKKRF